MKKYEMPEVEVSQIITEQVANGGTKSTNDTIPQI